MKRSLLLMVLIASMLAPLGMALRGSSARADEGQPAAQADPPVRSRYTITDLGTLGGDTSQAFAVNKEGYVVGLAKRSAQIYHAFVWDGETMTDLGTLDGQQSIAFGINDSGQVAGWSHTSSGDNRGFLWENGSMQPLGTLGGADSQANGVNNSGQVVGSASIVDNTDPSDPFEYPHAFLWQNGSMQDLGTLGGDQSYAYGINDTGQVVGQAVVGGAGDPPGHAFLWQNNSMQDLGTLGGYLSLAQAINNSGQVVGWSHLPNWNKHAFLWKDNVMQDLGTLGGNLSEAYDINDAGQVVGYSTNSAQQGHAVLWENGQMKDLNTLIPADSGWVLWSARGINKRGQITGHGVINGQTHGFLLTPRLPVLIVPGIAGTYAANQFHDFPWLIQRGVHPDDLQVDPLGRFYHDMIQTFKNLGYEEGKDLFVVNYDWRLMPGPIDGQFDGRISGLNAQSLADNQFRYAVDYLGWYLRRAAEAYFNATGLELGAVNVIAHSTGGLVARTYIQSDAYGGVYDAVNNRHLPTIDQFIMVGVPNRGASKAWNPLHDNWGSDVAYRAVLSKIVNRAYQKVLHAGIIQGPDYHINLASIMVNDSPDPEVFIQKYVPTIRFLLATYDFIDFGEGFTHVNNDPAQRNATVLDLNNGLDLMPTLDPNPFAGQTSTTVICGSSSLTARFVVERTGTAAQDALLPFSDFLPNDAGVADEWYEDVWWQQGGDETVPLVSCRDQFVGDGRVDILEFSTGGNTAGDTSHTGLMSNVDVQSAILDALAVEYEDTDIETGTGMGWLSIVSVISDPVGTVLVDGAGRRLGYSRATGAITEIPGSLWFGGYEGIGYVFGNVTTPLHLKLTGLGEDYYVMASVERDGKPVGGAVSRGYLAQGRAITVPVVLGSPAPPPGAPANRLFLPVVTKR